MGLEEVIQIYVPGYLDFVSDVLQRMAEFFAGGVLVAFLIWTIGYAVRTVFGWLSDFRE